MKKIHCEALPACLECEFKLVINAIVNNAGTMPSIDLPMDCL